jgi:hypothetical protein
VVPDGSMELVLSSRDSLVQLGPSVMRSPLTKWSKVFSSRVRPSKRRCDLYFARPTPSKAHRRSRVRSRRSRRRAARPGDRPSSAAPSAASGSRRRGSRRTRERGGSRRRTSVRRCFRRDAGASGPVATERLLDGDLRNALGDEALGVWMSRIDASSCPSSRRSRASLHACFPLRFALPREAARAGGSSRAARPSVQRTPAGSCRSARPATPPSSRAGRRGRRPRAALRRGARQHRPSGGVDPLPSEA